MTQVQVGTKVSHRAQGRGVRWTGFPSRIVLSRAPDEVATIDIGQSAQVSLDFATARPTGYRAVVLRDGVPLAEEIVRCSDDVERVIRSFVRTDVSAAPTRALEADAVMADDVALIVCSKDRAVLLDGCLAAIGKMRPPPGEVLVVDNGSRDGSTLAVAARHGVRVVVEPRPGLDRARNRGTAETTSPIVAFLDDDTRPEPKWAGAVQRAFSDPAIGAVSGLVLAAELRSWTQRAFERNGGMRKGFEVRHFSREGHSFGVRPQEAGIGANCAFRRTIFDAVGGFDVALDLGTPTRGGGDLDMLYRVQEGGATVRYDPSMWIRHVHRSDVRGLVRQFVGYGVGYTAFMEKCAIESDSRSMIRRDLRRWRFRRQAVSLVGSILRLDAFRALLALAEAWGSLSGARAYRASINVVDERDRAGGDAEDSRGGDRRQRRSRTGAAA